MSLKNIHNYCSNIKKQVKIPKLLITSLLFTTLSCTNNNKITSNKSDVVNTSKKSELQYDHQKETLMQCTASYEEYILEQKQRKYRVDDISNIVTLKLEDTLNSEEIIEPISDDILELISKEDNDTQCEEIVETFPEIEFNDIESLEDTHEKLWDEWFIDLLCEEINNPKRWLSIEYICKKIYELSWDNLSFSHSALENILKKISNVEIRNEVKNLYNTVHDDLINVWSSFLR